MIPTDSAKDSLLKFLQDIFGQEEFYGDEGEPLRNDFLWRPDDNETKIMIMDSNTENLEAVEKRPALIISRGPIQWQKLSIDQMVNFNMRLNERSHLDLMSSTLRVNCFSQEGLEAEFLASIVFQCVQFFSRCIQKTSNVFEIASVQIGEESIVASDSRIDLTVVPVIVSLYLTANWKVSPRGISMENMAINIGAGSKLPDGRTSVEHITDP